MNDMTQPQPEIVIESGIPIPPQASRMGPITAALLKMQVGDSFFVRYVSGKKPHAKLYAMSKRLGQKHTVRAATENGFQGMRVWRIE